MASTNVTEYFNFIHQKYHDKAKDVLEEASMSRFWHHLTEDGDCIAIVSAERGERDGLTFFQNKNLNKKNTRSLRKFVNIHGYGFNKTKGGYVEVRSDGSSNEITEESTAIYAHCTDEKEERTFKNFIIALGKKYEQECVFFVGLNKHAKWIFTTSPNFSGLPVGSEMDCGAFHPTQIGDYFTKIGKKKCSFVVEAQEYKTIEWFNWTPLERRGYDYMSNQLRVLTENNEDYYDAYFETASKSVDKYPLITDEVNEASLSRLWQHFHKGDPILIISAQREGMTAAEKNKVYEMLQKEIDRALFGYVKVKGGYYEYHNGKMEEVKGEYSCVVFGTKDTEKRLLNLGIKLGKEFNQDSILWVNTEGNACWIYTNDVKNHKEGDKVPLGDFHTDQIGLYYTKIGKKKFSFSYIDESCNLKSYFGVFDKIQSMNLLKEIDNM